MRFRSVLVLSTVTLAGCATPYQDADTYGGVTAIPITEDSFLISARGNGFTDASTVQKFFLLKASETTLAAGATHFKIISSQDRTIVTYVTEQTVNLPTKMIVKMYDPNLGYSMKKPGQDTLIEIFSLSEGMAPPPGSFSAGRCVIGE